ncbi:FAD-binding oxidoreductase [Egibacter rhizosphaerae]|nr:FAD-linked oxidase C-terminal domain-containing protein [Egibacter rhizosphaerae]
MVIPNGVADLFAELVDIVGADGVHVGTFNRALYRSDAGPLNAEPLGVCLPGKSEEVERVVGACARRGVAMTPRGAGTGLAGGTVPLHRTLVVSLARMDRVTELDVEAGTALIEPGVVNSDLDAMVAPHGLRFAPDPSSQVACTLGGNVATNAGGAHCLAYGVTSAHVLELDLVDVHGRRHRLDGPAHEHDGYDLRGVTVGSEGTIGFVTSARLRLQPSPDAIRTVLAAFPSVRTAAESVADIVAEGAGPAALELMDKEAVRCVEPYARAGYPLDAGAVLLAEFEGPEGAVEHGLGIALAAVARHGSADPTIARTEDERARLWKGRKAIGGAVAGVAPDYYLHDVVVPRSRLADVLEEVGRIATDEQVTIVNAVHAGDGNLHPIIAFDRRDREEVARTLRAGERIVEVAIANGGVVSGEHGIGLEKQAFLCEDGIMTAEDRAFQARLRDALDDLGLANPGKVLPAPATCAEAQHTLVPEGAWI